MAGKKDISRRAGVPMDEVQSIFDAIAVMLSEGQQVKVPMFGTFAPKIEEPRTVKSSILPEGEATTPRRRVIRFRMSDKLRKDWRLE